MNHLNVKHSFPCPHYIIIALQPPHDWGQFSMSGCYNSLYVTPLTTGLLLPMVEMFPLVSQVLHGCRT